jgi:hypothetical protein
LNLPSRRFARQSRVHVDIGGGVSIGSLLSLFATPLLYSLLARRLQPIGRIRRRIQELERRHTVSAG